MKMAEKAWCLAVAVLVGTNARLANFQQVLDCFRGRDNHRHWASSPLPRSRNYKAKADIRA